MFFLSWEPPHEAMITVRWRESGALKNPSSIWVTSFSNNSLLPRPVRAEISYTASCDNESLLIMPRWKPRCVGSGYPSPSSEYLRSRGGLGPRARSMEAQWPIGSDMYLLRRASHLLS